MSPQEKPPIPWTILKDFTHDETKITVRVSAQEDYRSRHSIRIGRLIEVDGEIQLRPFLPVFVDVDMGNVTVRPVADVLNWLVRQAVEYIHVRAQEREDEITDIREKERHKLLSDEG